MSPIMKHIKTDTDDYDAKIVVVNMWAMITVYLRGEELLKQEHNISRNIIIVGIIRGMINNYEDGISKLSAELEEWDGNMETREHDIKYRCITNCAEVNEAQEAQHCIATLAERHEREDEHQDYCPCGNEDRWEKIAYDSKTHTVSNKEAL